MKRVFTVKNLGLAAIMIFFGVSFFKQEVTKKRLETEKTKVEQQIDSLKKKNVELTEEFKDSKSDSYIERMARERLGMIKEGEKVIIDSKKNE